MIHKSKAVVLHQIKYSETSVIVTLYTNNFGRQSYLINGIRSSKSKQKNGILQPLFLLEIDAYHKPGREIQRLKEFRLTYVFNSIPFDVSKSTISMFISEILYKVIRSEEQDQQLFDFIFQSVQYFDTLEKGASNFHLWFLINLLGYLGFKLQPNYGRENCWFDMKTGSFVSQQPNFPKTPNLEESEKMADLIHLHADNFFLYPITGKQRTRMLEIIVEYYALHIDGMGNINSLSVLRDIFA